MNFEDFELIEYIPVNITPEPGADIILVPPLPLSDSDSDISGDETDDNFV